jgi:TolB-like protein
VYFAVNQLRRALGDEGRDGTSYIETIRKRGYRLVARVELLPTTSPVENRQDVRAHSRLITSTLIGVAAVVAVGLGAALWHRAEPTLPGPIALAVLPFADLSPRGDRAHLADGVTEAIRTSLARVEGLQMTGRTSAEYFRNRNEELSRIAAVLGVDYVLEGSLGLEGDSVSITARLIDTASGFNPWSEPYRQTLDNVFVLQDEIAESVAAALEITLGVGELGRIPGMTRDVAAWNEFLTAVGTIELTPLAIQSAIDHLERALDIDPQYPVAGDDRAGAYEMTA